MLDSTKEVGEINNNSKERAIHLELRTFKLEIMNATKIFNLDRVI